MSTKIHATVDALGNPTRSHQTPGQAHDLEGADALLPDMPAATGIADKAYDAQERVIDALQDAGKKIVIPPNFHESMATPRMMKETSRWKCWVDASMTDLGRMNVTGLTADKGKFKVPTLRNIELTAPYMHDGRFATLEEVVDHYDQGGVSSSTVDPLMKHLQGSASPGLNLTLTDKQDLINFLKTLTDQDFITNPAFTHP